MGTTCSNSPEAPVRIGPTGWQGRSRILLACAGTLVACLILLSATAHQVSAQGLESPITSELVVKFGEYRADIDSEFEGTEGPYTRMFGPGGSFYVEMEYCYYLWRHWGALSVGVAVGFVSPSGYGLLADGTNSVDETDLNVLPTRFNLAYRFDVLPRELSIPLVPYLTVGLDYYLWWINSAAGIATYRSPDSEVIEEGRGQTFGWHVAGGVQFLLDVLAPRMSRTFDANTGVNNSYLFVEYLYADVSDFGSDSSFQLGDSTLLFGLAFEF
ncbi:MAG: hypothetical protein JW797_13745 [Bradymonadales bacterium]|nr:hypothetical protein [Bradymonadales bacterium]